LCAADKTLIVKHSFSHSAIIDNCISRPLLVQQATCGWLSS